MSGGVAVHTSMPLLCSECEQATLATQFTSSFVLLLHFSKRIVDDLAMQKYRHLVFFLCGGVRATHVVTAQP